MLSDKGQLTIPEVAMTKHLSRKEIQYAATKKLLCDANSTMRTWSAIGNTFSCVDPRSQKRWITHNGCSWDGRLVKDASSKKQLKTFLKGYSNPNLTQTYPKPGSNNNLRSVYKSNPNPNLTQT